MNLKKHLFVCLLAFAAICANAQEIKYGVTAGINFNSLSSNSNDARTGFHAGLKTEIDFNEKLYVNAGLMLTSKPWRGLGTYIPKENIIIDSKKTPYYLNIPVHVGYKLPVAKNVKIFGEAGPYIGIGLFGSGSSIVEQYDEGFKNLIESKKYDNGNPFKNNQKRFDWGLGGNIGVELFNHYQLSVGYDWGLKEILGKNTSMKNKTFMISASYLF